MYSFIDNSFLIPSTSKYYLARVLHTGNICSKSTIFTKNKTMNTIAIRQKLYEYIRVADDKKVKAMYTIIEDHPNEIDEWWKDKDFISTLDRISSDLKSGVDKGYLWEEVRNELLNTPNRSTQNGK